MRPCFIVLDYDLPGAVSARKLVIESARLNVITAYSQDEAVETLERYPVDGVVINTHVEGRLTCQQFIEKLRKVRRGVPIVTVSASGDAPGDGEQFHVSSYDPRSLLTVLEKMSPDAARAIEHEDEREEEIEREKRGEN
jgi:DNA-binding NtrC family response regulator